MSRGPDPLAGREDPDSRDEPAPLPGGEAEPVPAGHREVAPGEAGPAHTVLGFERAVVALGMARMADAVANSFLIIVLPLYVASGRVGASGLGLEEAAATGVILAVFGLFNAGLQPFAGRLSDRLGRRKVFVLLGLVVLAFTHYLYTFADSHLALMAIRSVQGLSVAFTVTASVALVNELSEPERRGGNMGIYNSLRLLGFGTGPLAAGVVVSSGPYHLPFGISLDGFEATFLLAGLGALLSAGFVALFVRDAERTRPTAEKLAIRVRSASPDRVLDPIFTLGVATLFMAACIALLATIEPEVNRRLDQGPTLFAVQFAVFILSVALAQPVVGRASDRWGRKPFVVWGLLLLIPTTVVQGLVVTPGQMILARLAQGLAGAGVFAPALALAGDLAREGQSGAQLAVLTLSFGLGLSLGQLSSGFLVAYGYVVPFAFGGLLAALGAALVRSQVVEPARS